MRPSGRIAAAIEVLEAMEAQHRPAKLALKDWGAAHRFAGAKDRAWISGLVLDALRKKRSLAWRMGDDGARALVLACLSFSWRWSVEAIDEAVAEQPHGPGALSEAERARLNNPIAWDDAPTPVRGDYPDWLDGELTAVFGDERVVEGAALAERAPVDLRVNTLKTTPDKALHALSAVGAQPGNMITNAMRILAPEPGERAGHVESIPAFAKGWVEVQDLGSQIAAAAAGDIKGAQVLDYCAGGGGKTLALAAMSGGTGQVYAYDADGRRLAPAFERVRRAGARNVQIRSPLGEASHPLSDLVAKMDVVFVDAPCTGSGVWRRQPDAKWRLTERALETRIAEQTEILQAASAYVRPGGRLVYVTCSLFASENEARLREFVSRQAAFAAISAREQIKASGLAGEVSLKHLRACVVDAVTPGDGAALRLSPRRSGTDGFFISVLQRKGS